MLVPGDLGRLGTPIYVFTVESPQPVGPRHTSCKLLLRKPRDPGRQGTHISVVTTETSPCGQARHTHLRSYCGNLKKVYVCVLQFRSGARSYCENPNNVHVCTLYCRISARRTFT
jgi:hypothetical protein